MSATELRSFGLFVGGRSVPAASGRTFAVENPATAEKLADVAEADAADVDAAVEAASAAAPAWGAASGRERAQVLERAAELLADRLAELVLVEVDQTGRAYRELSAQLARLPEWYEYFGAVARTHEDTVPEFGGPYLNYVRRVPLGVVGQITPWNHPLLILTKKVAPALAAGNAAVVKPSELAPLTAILLGEILRDAGLPDGVYNVVPGFGATAGAALSAHPALRKLDITGGTETGRAVAALAGRNLAYVNAELGGKAAVLVFDDVHVRAGVAAALFAGFIATGQTCVQGARVLVQRRIHDELVAELGRRAGEIVLGDPRDPATQLGPLVSAAQLERVERYVAIGLEEGATLVAGGRRPESGALPSGHYYLPTVFADVSPEMRIAREEIFGPFVCVLPFDSEDEAVELANATEFGLAASVWTNDVRRAHRVADRVRSGIVWINDHHRIDPASPWGGFGASGVGRENGIEAYRQYTEVKSVVVNLDDGAADWYDSGRTGPQRYS